MTKLELNLDSVMLKNPFFLTAVFGYFNGKLSLWYKSGIDIYEGSETDDVTSQFGLQ